MLRSVLGRCSHGRLTKGRWLIACALASLISSPLYSQDPTPEPEIDPLDAELDRLGEEGEGVAKKLFDEIENNMREVERLLGRKDTGESSQSRQVQTIETIEKLIEELNKT